jgi:geranylgeranyl pyrophosphate synthase
LGKVPGEDMREGKGTLLVLYALQHTAPADRQFLQSCLGNPKFNVKDLARCQQIIKESGALDHARQIASKHLQAALRALDEPKGLWSQDGTNFLRHLAQSLQDRAA